MKVSYALAALAFVLLGASVLAFPNPALVQQELLERSQELRIRLQVDPPPSTPGAGPSPACTAAIQAFSTAAQSCGNFIVPIGGNLTNDNIAAICSGNCVNTIKTSLKSLLEACGGAMEGLDALTDLFSKALRLTCLKYNGQYCYANVTQSFGAFSDHAGSDFGPADLAKICTPCTALYLKAVAELNFNNDSMSSGGDPTQFFNILCVKNGDEFCYPKFRNFSFASEQSSLKPPPAELLCDRCIQKALARSLGPDGISLPGVDSGVLQQSLNLTNQFCARDGQNRLCAQILGDTPQAVVKYCDANAIALGNCSSNCTIAVNQMITAGGCCAGLVLVQASQQFGIPVSALVQALKFSCHVTATIPDACAARTANVLISLSNLKYTYYIAHKAEIDAKIIADIAAQAGVPASSVSITSASAQSVSKYTTMSISLLATGGTSVTTTITSTGDVAAIQTDLQSTQAAGLLSFPSLSQLPTDASVDPTASAGATPDPGSNTNGSGGSSGAVNLLVQPLTLLVLMLVALALIA